MGEKKHISTWFEVRILVFLLAGIILATLAGFAAFFSFFGKPFGSSFSNTIYALKHLREYIFPVVTFVFLVFTASASIVVLVVATFALHKVAGPTVRLEKIFESMKMGEYHEEINLRKGDELSSLSDVLTRLNKKLGEERRSILKNLRDVERIIYSVLGGDSSDVRISDLERKIAEIEEIAGRYVKN